MLISKNENNCLDWPRFVRNRSVKSILAIKAKKVRARKIIIALILATLARTSSPQAVRMINVQTANEIGGKEDSSGCSRFLVKKAKPYSRKYGSI